MQKFILFFCFLGLFPAATHAQSNMKTALYAPKTQNERSITPSKKPLSVKPIASQPKEEVIEEVTVVKTPRRMATFKPAQTTNAETNSAKNSKVNAGDTRKINLRKQVKMREE